MMVVPTLLLRLHVCLEFCKCRLRISYIPGLKRLAQ